MNIRIDPNKIALRPARPRHSSKLMVVYLPSLKIEEVIFKDICRYMKPCDALAVNDSSVINAKLKGKRKSGGKTEFLLVRKDGGFWEGLGKPASRLKEGEEVDIISPSGKKTSVNIKKKKKNGKFILQTPADILNYGYIPLPPYIASRRETDLKDGSDYRSFFSLRPGSVASPTASLHFSKELIGKLKRKGVKIAPVTLHVGPGTFIGPGAGPPPEKYLLSPASARIIGDAERVLICGTTVMRTLESCRIENGSVQASEGETSLYIKPGYRFKNRGMFLTNFHLPGTPLINLVGAYIGEKIGGEGLKALEEIYKRALKNDYRFLSYGDAMLMIDGENEK